MARDGVAKDVSARPIFHVVRASDLVWDDDDCYRPASLRTEGFAHASYRERVVESARLYFPRDADLRVLELDPSKLGAGIDVADTPRGPMPHVLGPIPRSAVVRIRLVGDLEDEAT